MPNRTNQIIIIGSDPDFIGKFGDTLENTSLGVWNFGGAVIEGATFIGFEQFSQSTNSFWVHPLFTETGVFFQTIQAAIDAVAGEDVVINILPGVYDGFFIDTLTNLTLNGIGRVEIGSPHSDTSPLGPIRIKDSSKIVFNNIEINGDHHDYGADPVIYGIEIDNSEFELNNSILRFDTIVVNTDYEFSFIYISPVSGLVKVNSSTFHVNVDCENNNVLETLNGIYYNDVSVSKKLKVYNSTFKLVQENEGGASGTSEFNIVNIVNEPNAKWDVLFNACEFDIAYDGNSTPEVITGELPKVAVINSISNTALSIDIISNNTIEDTDFSI